MENILRGDVLFSLNRKDLLLFPPLLGETDFYS